jgi:hypothetical protein
LLRTSALKEAKSSIINPILNFSSNNLTENLAFTRKGFRRIRISKKSENNSIPEGTISIREIMHHNGVNLIRKPSRSHNNIIIRTPRSKPVANNSRVWPLEALKSKCPTCTTRLLRTD